MMKIKDLIEKLKEFPDDYRVCPCKCGEELLVFDAENNVQNIKIL